MSHTTTARLPINLALQGGGAHGALTWGVLDRLLADGRLDVSGLSGTSAGAMNAVALAQGLMDDGTDGARAALERFWQAVAGTMPAEATVLASDGAGARLAPMARLLLHWSHYLSPSQSNPLDLNPLRDIVQSQFDFERLRHSPGPALLIAATAARTGRLRLFRRPELSAEAVLASACLPTLFRPVEIEGEPYWDGGYSANPPVLPLVEEDGCARDTLLVLLTPLRHAEMPQSAASIQARTLDISFNAAFLREMALLTDWREQARRSWLPLGRQNRRLARSEFHLIDAGAWLGTLGDDSKLAVHPEYFEALRDRGRDMAAEWLERHAARLGRHAGISLREVFG